MLATAALFVKLDSAKNLPVSHANLPLLIKTNQSTPLKQKPKHLDPWYLNVSRYESYWFIYQYCTILPILEQFGISLFNPFTPELKKYILPNF